MEDEPSPASGIEAFRDLERCLSGAVGGLAEIERESESSWTFAVAPPWTLEVAPPRVGVGVMVDVA